MQIAIGPDCITLESESDAENDQIVRLFDRAAEHRHGPTLSTWFVGARKVRSLSLSLPKEEK